MAKVIHAIFENGVFRPAEKINLPEHLRSSNHYPRRYPARLIAVVAERAGRFDFLANSREDIYTIADGEPI